jgi:hypothetical protein
VERQKRFVNRPEGRLARKGTERQNRLVEMRRVGGPVRPYAPTNSYTPAGPTWDNLAPYPPGNVVLRLVNSSESALQW